MSGGVGGGRMRAFCPLICPPNDSQWAGNRSIANSQPTSSLAGRTFNCGDGVDLDPLLYISSHSSGLEHITLVAPVEFVEGPGP